MQEQGAPAADDGDASSFMRKPAAAVVAGINTEEVFVPTIPKNDATLAMLENAVKGTILLLLHHCGAARLHRCSFRPQTARYN